jgi:hypothetical protein
LVPIASPYSNKGVLSRASIVKVEVVCNNDAIGTGEELWTVATGGGISLVGERLQRKTIVSVNAFPNLQPDSGAVNNILDEAHCISAKFCDSNSVEATNYVDAFDAAKGAFYSSGNPFAANCKFQAHFFPVASFPSILLKVESGATPNLNGGEAVTFYTQVSFWY